MTEGNFSSIPLLPSLRGKAEAIYNLTHFTLYCFVIARFHLWNRGNP
ncbi:hypothetical protein [Helicobacter sp.]|nr:hypothetical protein [Helicobacter sp.]MCI5633809.1 hypothetical protein [Helicobacter sp.]